MRTSLSTKVDDGAPLRVVLLPKCRMGWLRTQEWTREAARASLLSLGSSRDEQITYLEFFTFTGRRTLGQGKRMGRASLLLAIVLVWFGLVYTQLRAPAASDGKGTGGRQGNKLVDVLYMNFLLWLDRRWW